MDEDRPCHDRSEEKSSEGGSMFGFLIVHSEDLINDITAFMLN